MDNTMFSMTSLSTESFWCCFCVANNIQLTPEGEVNSGGYIYRDAKCRGIYPPLFTDPEGDSCFSTVFTKSDG